ncbi:hypothetical protein CHLRE_03g183550v5 [Chlamydomonas reinhardtii]|uniref:BFN domain-containing protein n=1 Tax=Chlamydomonas reinhardtii TaxID=3055 RepID=A0A2K3DXY5_CHLRE|nr:uncharacterized protein CHLRE_03g183550v5 [Chlamydomonas reinhardtii]PNW85377.1 hypothetical protein CHLRE_03g183550v5 [Chlamydomonas reinhardtii]
MSSFALGLGASGALAPCRQSPSRSQVPIHCTNSLAAARSSALASTSSSVSSGGVGAARTAACSLRRGKAAIRGGCSIAKASAGEGALFPFAESDYHRVVLLDRQPYGPMKILPATDQSAGTYSGVLVFQRDADLTLTPDTNILEIFVAGDTATNIYTQLQNTKSARPMVHDLMFNMLTRAAQTNGRQWQLLRVAIVALENDIFVGRLFFGDPATGVVAWDCDCRPSDGVYLSMRSGCPFYVAQIVWDVAAVPIRASKVHMIAVHEAHMAAVQQQQQQHGHAHQQQQQPAPQQQQQSGAASSSGGGNGTVFPRASSGAWGAQQEGASSIVPPPSPPSASDDYTQLKPDDMDAIKLLKRELAVAVREEDYAAAIRLRDHPFMQMYRRIEALNHLGRGEEATRLQNELVAMVQRTHAEATY